MVVADDEDQDFHDVAYFADCDIEAERLWDDLVTSRYEPQVRLLQAFGATTEEAKLAVDSGFTGMRSVPSAEVGNSELSDALALTMFLRKRYHDSLIYRGKHSIKIDSDAGSYEHIADWLDDYVGYLRELERALLYQKLRHFSRALWPRFIGTPAVNLALELLAARMSHSPKKG